MQPRRTGVIFTFLLLFHTAMLSYGLVSFWTQVTLKGDATVSALGDDDTGGDVEPLATESFSAVVYKATFWINVRQFWDSGAKAIACLIYFAGVVQPILRALACVVLAFAPMSAGTRNRMITVQELTCKVPLATFYVEAYLLIVVVFRVQYAYDRDPLLGSYSSRNGAELGLDARTHVWNFDGLPIFLTAQMTFLVLVNLVRLEHRRQTKATAAMALESDYLALSSSSSITYVPPSLRPRGTTSSYILDPAAAASSPSLMTPPHPLPDGQSPPSTRTVYGPSRLRPVCRRVLLALLAVVVLVGIALSLVLPVVKFTYTGVAAAYLTLDGAEYTAVTKDAWHDDNMLALLRPAAARATCRAVREVQGLVFNATCGSDNFTSQTIVGGSDDDASLVITAGDVCDGVHVLVYNNTFDDALSSYDYVNLPNLTHGHYWRQMNDFCTCKGLTKAKCVVSQKVCPAVTEMLPPPFCSNATFSPRAAASVSDVSTGTIDVAVTNQMVCDLTANVANNWDVIDTAFLDRMSQYESQCQALFQQGEGSAATTTDGFDDNDDNDDGQGDDSRTVKQPSIELTILDVITRLTKGSRPLRTSTYYQVAAWIIIVIIPALVATLGKEE